MSFEVVETEPKPRNSSRNISATISYRRSKRAKVHVRPSLTIGIPKAVIDEALGLKPSQFFVLTVGSGSDSGKARLIPADGLGVAVQIGVRGGATFRFGYVPYLGDDAAEKEFIGVRIHNDGFELDLPAWFKPQIRNNVEEQSKSVRLREKLSSYGR